MDRGIFEGPGIRTMTHEKRGSNSYFRNWLLLLHPECDNQPELSPGVDKLEKMVKEQEATFLRFLESPRLDMEVFPIQLT